MKVNIIGAGIGGLTLALFLHKLDIPCSIYEAVAEINPLGAGINLLPHATQVLAEIGIVERLLEEGIETREICFYTRHGQLVDREPRGRFAGYRHPQISIHRADLHKVLLHAVRERMGAGTLMLGWTCRSVTQSEENVRLHFVDPCGRTLPEAEATVAIACDGIHSAIRKQFHSTEAAPIDHGTTSFRGVTRWKPFLTGASMAYVGTYDTGKLVVYPVRDDLDSDNRQLINWVLEVKTPNDRIRDWNRRVDIETCIGPFEKWRFDWLDVAAMLRAADEVLQYPNVDQNALPFWTQGRVTLLGDAAHPMLPRGSNGAAQAIIDAKVLAELLASADAPASALKAYESIRRPATTDVVLSNRNRSPDAILRVVEERTGDKPFDNIADVITREEMDAWQDGYKAVAGFLRGAAAQGADY